VSIFHYHLALAYFVAGDKSQAWEEYRTLNRLDANLAAKLKAALDN